MGFFFKKKKVGVASGVETCIIASHLFILFVEQ
jgi:hypothetical protein